MILEKVQGSGVCSEFDVARKPGGILQLNFFTNLTLKVRGMK